MEQFARVSTVDPRQILCGALIKGLPTCAGILGTAELVGDTKVLALPVDFQEVRGVWMLSRDAHERIRLGLAPRRASTTRLRTPHIYPARVQCPHCGQISVLEGAILGLDPMPSLRRLKRLYLRFKAGCAPLCRCLLLLSARPEQRSACKPRPAAPHRPVRRTAW